MREDASFDAEGCTLRGWLYRPSGRERLAPAVVMAHGWGAVKEMYLDVFAEAFAAAGCVVLVFDHRNFGASDGDLRQEVDPWAQVRDYRHAITFASTLDGVDSDRLGVWGTSYSGGHALVVGAIDRRVRCIVAQCPTISGWRNTVRRFPGDALTARRRAWDEDRLTRSRHGAPAMAPIVVGELGDGAEDSADGTAVPVGNDGAAWFRAMPATRRAAWKNELTSRSYELYAEYEPGSYVSRIGPTPLRIVTAEGDTLTPTDEIRTAYAEAREPKSLVVLRGGHYDLYGTQRSAAAEAARDWFATHLCLARA